VFVLDMGQPVRVQQLAEKLIHLSGMKVRSTSSPEGDIEIKHVGLRPGEKLYEELLIGNNPTSTQHPRIFMAEEARLTAAVLDWHLAGIAESILNGSESVARTQLFEAIQAADRNFYRIRQSNSLVAGLFSSDSVRVKAGDAAATKEIPQMAARVISGRV
jgi:FlaA1/EpsC-like NDP-sugar epimerase